MNERKRIEVSPWVAGLIIYGIVGFMVLLGVFARTESRVALVVLALHTIVVGFLLIEVFHRHERKRTEILRAVGEGMGFAFSSEDDPILREGLSHFRLFSQGRQLETKNILLRKFEDFSVTVFPYHYWTASGEHGTQHKQTVILFESGALRLPAFTLRPKRLYHKLGKEVLGHRFIDFDSHREFAKRYSLQGEPDREVRKLFTPDVLSYFANLEEVCVEGADTQLIYYRASREEILTQVPKPRVVTPEGIPEFIIEGTEALSLFAPSLSNQIIELRQLCEAASVAKNSGANS